MPAVTVLCLTVTFIWTFFDFPIALFMNDKLYDISDWLHLTGCG